MRLLAPISVFIVATAFAPAAPTPAFALQARRDFPVVVYRQAYAGREAPAELLEPFGGVHVRGAEAAEWVLARGLDFYVEHSAGRDDLHLDRDRGDARARWQGFFDTRDPRFLLREPCLTDSTTRERLFATLAATLDARGGAYGLGYSLGDEVSLTAAGAPEDVCLSPSCRAAWRSWLERRGLLARAAEASADDLEAVSTDAALAALSSDAPEARRLLEFWLLRREFHHGVVLDLLRELAQRVRATRAGAPVGLMGFAGETAFGNVAVERSLEFLDFVECYRTADATELAFTLRDPAQRVYATLFPSVRAPTAWAWATSEQFLRGGDGAIVWCDRELERSTELHATLSGATELVRRLRRELEGFRPTPRGLAVLRSSRNLAWCWLRDAEDDGASWPKRMASWQADHGRVELATRAWLELAEDVGLLPGVLPLDRAGPELVARFPYLVAAALECVEDSELAALASYLQAGGRLIVDDGFAAFDARAEPRSRESRSAWIADRKGRVLAAPSGVAGYVALRDEGLRAALVGLLAVAGVERAPLVPRAVRRDVPWLVASESRADGSRVCVALPKFRGVGRDAGVGARAPAPELFELEVEAAARDGGSLEWLHPPATPAGKRMLRAGDPLVVRLPPRRQ
ncbi:MAG: hypothetical protein L6Q99_00375 [Planctomycetes bacterium]|nr:hypothetical protein [Planctomycetota bacterium]